MVGPETPTPEDLKGIIREPNGELIGLKGTPAPEIESTSDSSVSRAGSDDGDSLD